MLVNPFGGKKRAETWYTHDIEPIFVAARCKVDVERTRYKGHAVEIAQSIDVDAYDVIATCSGDGLPHEVFNGLGKRPDARKALSQVAVVQLPCGTGNAMSWNLNGTDSPSLAALRVVKGIRTPLDLVSITQGSTRMLSFLSQAVGIIAESDLGTEDMRWLGDTRFTLGVLNRLLRKRTWPCDIAIKVEIDSKATIREHYLSQARSGLSPVAQQQLRSSNQAPLRQEGRGLPELQHGTVLDELPVGWTMVPYDKLGMFYCGNMNWMSADTPFFAASLPHDGMMDLVTFDGDISRFAGIKMLLAVEKNQLYDIPIVHYRKVSAYRIIPRSGPDGYISIDGEAIAFEPFQAEIHHGLGMVLSKSGSVFEGEGVPASRST